MAIKDPRRVDPIGRTQIVEDDGTATSFYARQWQSLIDLVTSVIDLKDESESNASRITTAEQSIESIEETEIGGDGIDIQPALTPLSSGDITLSLTTTGVTAGVYGDGTNTPQITVDAKGRITDVVDVPITGGGGGSSAWTLVGSQLIAAPTANVDFINLGGYTDLIFGFIQVTAASNSTRNILVSTDNGVSYFNAVGDYRQVFSSGGEGGFADITVSSISTTAAVSSTTYLLGNINNSYKIFNILNRAFEYRLASQSGVVNAVRFRSAGINMTGGTVFVYGR